MKVQTIVYVTDMGLSRAWYGEVLDREPAFESEMWTPFTVGDATVALHRISHLAEGSRCDLSLVTDVAL
jgi:hypothetical protein